MKISACAIELISAASIVGAHDFRVKAMVFRVVIKGLGLSALKTRQTSPGGRARAHHGI